MRLAIAPEEVRVPPVRAASFRRRMAFLCEQRSKTIYEQPIGPSRPCLAYFAPSISPGLKIVMEVCFAHNVSIDDVRARRRSPAIDAARQEAQWRVRTELKWSLPRIGRLTKRDHTAVLHGVRRHQERLDRAAHLEGARG